MRPLNMHERSSGRAGTESGLRLAFEPGPPALRVKPCYPPVTPALAQLLRDAERDRERKALGRLAADVSKSLAVTLRPSPASAGAPMAGA